MRAARALGVSHARILARHILPNLLPIVIISITLGVSQLILSEAILSYLQLRVQGDTGSWGNMIDASRLEPSRDPIIWWNLTAASTALFVLVLAFNVFGDALRDAVDPRLRSRDGECGKHGPGREYGEWRKDGKFGTIRRFYRGVPSSANIPDFPNRYCCAISPNRPHPSRGATASGYRPSHLFRHDVRRRARR